MLHGIRKPAISAKEKHAEESLMSDNWILIVPKLPEHVPSSDQAHAALELLKETITNADEIEIVQKEHVQFFDCGANLETITCRRCTLLSTLIGGARQCRQTLTKRQVFDSTATRCLAVRRPFHSMNWTMSFIRLSVVLH